jgi:tRNA nucleotidyltransferase (CCA-adding enzyme)
MNKYSKKYANENNVYSSNLNIPISKTGLEILQHLNSAGKLSLVVGGAVRDAIMGVEPKDIDIEVYDITYEELEKILNKHGKTNVVGKSFGIIKFSDSQRNEYDFSIPRRDSKVTDSTSSSGRGFKSTFDKNISPKEAASRRDFTMNAMAYDPINKNLYDFFGGIEDIKNKTLKATSSEFSEDPLRVLRGMQFAARFDFNLDPETAKLAASIKSSELVKERVADEWMKMLTKGKYPSRVIQYLIDTEWIDNYPELKAVVGLEQDPEHHPEGTVDRHLALSMDVAAKLSDENNISGDDRAVLILAALTHDLGKAVTTKREMVKDKERITSKGHHTEGVPIVKSFLKSIGVKKSIADKVVPLTEYHMEHLFFSPKSKTNTIRHLAEKIFPATMEQLEYIMLADSGARPPLPGDLKDSAKDMMELAKSEGVYKGKTSPVLSGRDLLDTFTFLKQDKYIGEILKTIYEHQLRGDVRTKEDALNMADNILKSKYILIDGNDVMTYLNISPGPKIKDILNDVWKAQKNGEFSDKSGALSWLDRYKDIDMEFTTAKTLDEIIKKYAESDFIKTEEDVEEVVEDLNTKDIDSIPEDIIENIEDALERNTAMPTKISFITYMKGHKNSRGEPSPWVIKDHDNGKVLSSHATKQKAKSHLRDMHTHKNSSYNNKTFLGIRSCEDVLNKFSDDTTIDRMVHENLQYSSGQFSLLEENYGGEDHVVGKIKVFNKVLIKDFIPHIINNLNILNNDTLEEFLKTSLMGEDAITTIKKNSKTFSELVKEIIFRNKTMFSETELVLLSKTYSKMSEDDFSNFVAYDLKADYDVSVLGDYFVIIIEIWV